MKKMSKDELVLMIALFASAFVFILITGCCWWRKCCCFRSKFEYEKVSHSLDEEEIEFQRFIEKPASSNINHSDSSTGNSNNGKSTGWGRKRVTNSKKENNGKSNTLTALLRRGDDSKGDEDSPTQLNLADLEAGAFAADDDDDEDIHFDSQELNRLTMLEKYRANLVAGANLVSSTSQVGIHNNVSEDAKDHHKEDARAVDEAMHL